ncbi:C2 domain [Carpediemonas membranifera]|uniref:C2 domain n=1 Tax=Carpediemonas membranifera TaxID=201153 RepID=A0A8J6E1X7_9EUKA|nr:C2 domain [Carpediemonas membranifera]|eukprot:KAG9393611.1 C2 domain [Carpediemonas membranifera]
MSTPEPEPSGFQPVLVDTFLKVDSSGKSWKERAHVLTALSFSYYKTDEPMTDQKGFLALKDVTEVRRATSADPVPKNASLIGLALVSPARTQYLFHQDENVIALWEATTKRLIAAIGDHSPTLDASRTEVLFHALSITSGKLFGKLGSGKNFQLQINLKDGDKLIFATEIAWEISKKDVAWTPAVLTSAVKPDTELVLKVISIDNFATGEQKVHSSGSVKFSDIVLGQAKTIAMTGQAKYDLVVAGVRTKPAGDSPAPVGDKISVELQVPSNPKKQYLLKVLKGNILMMRAPSSSVSGNVAKWDQFALSRTAISPAETLTFEVFCEATNGTLTPIGSSPMVMSDIVMTKHLLKPLTLPDAPATSSTPIVAVRWSGGTDDIAECSPIKASTRYLRFNLACTKLAAMDSGIGRKSSDPFFVIKSATPSDPCKALRQRLKLPPVTDANVPIYKTEVQKKNLNPTFEGIILALESCDSYDSTITFECNDEDNDGQTDFIGSCTTTLRELCFAGTKFVLHCDDKGPTVSRGLVEITNLEQLEENPSHQMASTLDFRFEKLASSITDKTDPYLEIIARPILPPSHTVTLPMDQQGIVEPPCPMPLVPPAPWGPFERHAEEVTIYRSAVQMNNRDPKYESIRLDAVACGGPDALIKVQIMDWDKYGDNDLVAETVTTYRVLTQCCVDDVQRTFLYRLDKSQKHRGRMYIGNVRPDVEAEPIIDTPLSATLKIEGLKLQNMDKNILKKSSKSDPYFTLARKIEPDIEIYRSEVKMDDLNPEWDQFSIPLHRVNFCSDYKAAMKARKAKTAEIGGRTDANALTWLRQNMPRLPDLCSTGLDDLLVITVNDYEIGGVPELIGSAEITLRQMMSPDAPHEAALHREGKLKSSGTVVVSSVLTSVEPLLDPLVLEFDAAAAKLKSERLDIADPFLEVRNSAGQLVYRSNVVMNSTAPQFDRSSISLAPQGIVYARATFSEQLTWRVRDYEKNGDHDDIGMFTASLRNICSGYKAYPLLEPSGEAAHGSGLSVKKLVRRNNGVVTFSNVTHEPASISAFVKSLGKGKDVSTAVVTLSAKNLLKMNGIGPAATSSNPFFIVYAEPSLPALHKGAKKDKSPLYVPIYQSEILEDTFNPEWKPFSLTPTMCGSIDNALIIEVFHGTSQAYKPIGGTVTSLYELAVSHARMPLIFKSPDKSERKSIWGAVRKSAFRNAGELFGHVEIGGPFVDHRPPVAPGYALTFSMKDVPRIEATKVDLFIRVSAFAQPSKYEDAAIAQMKARLGKNVMATHYPRRPVCLYTSEVRMNDDNPTFSPATLMTEKCGGADAPLLIEVFDYDADGSHDRLGYASTTLSHLIDDCPRLSLVIVDKKVRKRRATLCLNIDKVDVIEEDPGDAAIEFTLETVKRFKNKDKFSKSDPVLTVMALPSDETPFIDDKKLAAIRESAIDPTSYADFHKRAKAVAENFAVNFGPELIEKCEVPIYRSAVFKNNLSPTFENILLRYTSTGGPDEPIVLVVQDYDKSGVMDLIGMAVVTPRTLLTPGFLIPMVDPNGSNMVRKYNNSGVLKVTTARTIAPADLAPDMPGAQLTLSVAKVPKVEGLSKSDPYLVFKTRPVEIPLELVLNPLPAEEREAVAGIGRTGTECRILETEVHRGKKSCTFDPVTVFSPECGGIDQLIRLELYDFERDGSDTLIGSINTTLRMLITPEFRQAITPAGKSLGPLQALKGSGIVTVDAVAPLNTMPEHIYSPPGAITFTVNAKGLDKKDTVSRSSDPFLDIYCTPYGCKGERRLVYRSEVHNRDLNPTFDDVTLTLRDMGGIYSDLEIEISDSDKDGSSDLIGVCSIPVKVIMNRGKAGYDTVLINDEKKTNPVYHNSGKLNVAVKRMMSIDEAADVEPPLAAMVSFSVTKLTRMDMSTGADPVLQIISEDDEILYQSEVHRRTLNADFTPIYLDVARCGGMYAPLTVRISDWEKSGALSKISEITAFSFRLMNLRTMVRFPWAMPLEKGRVGRNAGTLTMTSCDRADPRTLPVAYKLQLEGKNIPRMDGALRKSDPYLVVKGRMYKNAPEHIIYRTETIKQSLTPVFAPFQIDSASVGSLTSTFTIELWDYDSISADSLIGKAHVTLQQLTVPEAMVVLQNDGGAGLLRKNRGILSVISATEVLPEYADMTAGEVVVGSALTHPTTVKVTLEFGKMDRKDALSKNDPFLTVTGPLLSNPVTFSQKGETRSHAALLPMGTAKAFKQRSVYGPYTSEVSATHAMLPTGVHAAEPSPAMAVALANAGVVLRTEVKMNQSTPTFEVTLIPELVGGIDSLLTLELWDWDSDADHSLVGKTEVSIRELLCPNVPRLRFARVSKGLHVRSYAAEAKVVGRAESRGKVDNLFNNAGVEPVKMLVPKEAPAAPKHLTLTLAAVDLLSGDAMSAADALVKITRTSDGSEVFSTESIKDNSAPVWAPFTLDLTKLAGWHECLDFNVMDSDRVSSNDAIGFVSGITLAEIAWGCKHQFVIKKAGFHATLRRNAGKLIFKDAQLLG